MCGQTHKIFEEKSRMIGIMLEIPSLLLEENSLTFDSQPHCVEET